MSAGSKLMAMSAAIACVWTASPAMATVLTLDENGNYVVSESIKTDKAAINSDVTIGTTEALTAGDLSDKSSKLPKDPPAETGETVAETPKDSGAALNSERPVYDVFLTNSAAASAESLLYAEKSFEIDMLDRVDAADVPAATVALDVETIAPETLSLNMSTFDNGPVMASLVKPAAPTAAKIADPANKMPAFEQKTIDEAGEEAVYSGAYDDIIKAEIAKYKNVDMAFVTSVIETESNYNMTAVSAKGAMGLMQIMPETAKTYKVINPFSPAENIRAGTAELSRLMDIYNNPALALAAYNAGQGAVDTYDGVPPYRETQEYIVKVLTKTFEKRERQARAEIEVKAEPEKDKKFEPMQVQTFEWDSQ